MGDHDYTCCHCGVTVAYLEVFPGPACLACYARTPEGMRMPSAAELVAMWGGK